jgi:hypothetical protein
MKQIIALVLLFTWMLLIIIMMGEPQMNDQVNESVGSGPQWIGFPRLLCFGPKTADHPYRH